MTHRWNKIYHYFSFGKKKRESISIILDQTKQETSIVCCNLTVKNQIAILQKLGHDRTAAKSSKEKNNDIWESATRYTLIGRMREIMEKSWTDEFVAGKMRRALVLAGGHVDGTTSYSAPTSSRQTRTRATFVDIAGPYTFIAIISSWQCEMNVGACCGSMAPLTGNEALLNRDLSYALYESTPWGLR